MDFVLQTPSLQHLAGVRIVAHLWTQKDIFTQIAGLVGYDMRQEKVTWKAVEEAVKSCISALPLPGQCKKQLLNFVRPLGTEMLAWCRNHSEKKINFQFVGDILPQQIRWMMHGIIDYAETAQLMVKDERFDVQRRYEMACINCLEDAARQLFHRMGEDQRQEYYINRVRNRRGEHYHQLVFFFTCTFNDDAAFLHQYRHSPSSFHQCLFIDALYIGNRATCEYLFTKLDEREKGQVFEECQISSFNFKHACYDGNVYSMGSVLYYFSLMNEEEKELVLRRDGYHLLRCFLDWPMQTLIVEAAERGWQFMGNQDRTLFLRDTIFKISYGFIDYDYAQLFWECWRLSSAEFKQHFLNSIERLEELLATKEKEFIQLVLNEAPLYRLRELVDPRCERSSQVLMDENVISEAVLMACKNIVDQISANAPQDAEKRLRSEHVGRLVDAVMESRKSK